MASKGSFIIGIKSIKGLYSVLVELSERTGRELIIKLEYSMFLAPTIAT